MLTNPNTVGILRLRSRNARIIHEVGACSITMEPT